MGLDVVQGVAAQAVIGGTASVVGGGKFENGAVTAAFGYLFNDIAIRLDSSQAYGFGHVSIGVNTNDTVGLYPVHNGEWRWYDEILGEDLPGELRTQDLNGSVSTFVIKTTPETDRAVQTYLEKARVDPGNYNLWYRNCAIFIEGALRAGGIQTISTPMPRQLYDFYTSPLYRAQRRNLDIELR